MAGHAECTASRPAFAAAAPIAQTAITRRGGMTSASDSAALISAPATNPSWTAMVRKDDWLLDRCQSARSSVMTAEAENHVLMASSSAMASQVRARQRPAAGGVGVGTVVGIAFTLSLPLRGRAARAGRLPGPVSPPRPRR